MFSSPSDIKSLLTFPVLGHLVCLAIFLIANKKNTDFVVLKSLHTHRGSRVRGHRPFGRPICAKTSSSRLISWDVASMFLHNCFSLCHLFHGLHQSLLQQNTPTSWCCHPCTSWLAWCSQACKILYSFSKCNNFQHTNSILISSEHKTWFQKLRVLSQHIIFSLFFLNGVTASSLQSALSAHVNTRLVYLHIIIFTGFNQQSSQSLLLPKDDPELWSSTVLFFNFWADFFYFSNVSFKEAVFNVYLKNASTGESPVNWNVVN